MADWGRHKSLGSDISLLNIKVTNELAADRQAKERGCCLVVKLCLTLCDPMDCSLPGSFLHGILQA